MLIYVAKCLITRSAIFEAVVGIVHHIVLLIIIIMYCFFLLKDGAKTYEVDDDTYSSVGDCRINSRLKAQVKQVSSIVLL